jgi:glycosyltransferase involved in cell wall biosynthesis
MADVEVSIVIPTYNRKQLLVDMLNALSKQTLSPDRFEVTVIVDGSNDGTWEALQSMDQPYRLRSIYQQNAGDKSKLLGSGVSIARNKGVEMSESDIIVFMDDDILPVPELLESHLKMHTENANAVVLGKMLPSDEDHIKKGWNYWEEEVFAKHYREMAAGKRPPNGWRLYSANFSVRRSTFLKVGKFDPHMGNVRGEDVELGLRLESSGAVFLHSPQAGAIHRGYRTFDSWKKTAFILGPRDIFLAREKGFDHIIQGVGSTWARRSPIYKAAVRAYVRSGLVRKLSTAMLKNLSGALSFFKARSLAHKGYSIIFRFEYWRGVMSEMGGIEGLDSFSKSADRNASAYVFGSGSSQS